MMDNDRFWRLQHDNYLAQPYTPAHRYEAWQPGRWASNRSAVTGLKPILSGVKTALEVGAGSAAFSLELHRQLHCSIAAIDKSPEAKSYAQRIAEDMNITLDYLLGDLFDAEDKADLVLSLGVIEHYSPTEQKKFLQKCAALSNKYILVSIPNQDSVIFKNYVAWAARQSGEYEEEHQPLTVEALSQMMADCGLKLRAVDGFQVFLSERAFWNDMDVDAIPLYKKLKARPDCWPDFPRMDFGFTDIPKMVALETALTKEERLENSFMLYALAEK